MKGIVFTEFLEMVEDVFSDEVAEGIIDSADLPSGGVYTSVGSYSHVEMVKLVTELSKTVNKDSEFLVNAFGKHLFGRFHALYPKFFEDVNDSFHFLSNIEDVIHVEVKKLYPEAELPSFTYERPGLDTLVMTYSSIRPFGDLAHGLIEGCIEHYGEKINIEKEPVEDPEKTVVRFRLTKIH